MPLLTSGLKTCNFGDLLSYKELVSQFKAKLGEIVDKLNAKPEVVSRWLGTKYYGKIIAWRLKEADKETNLYIKITRNGENQLKSGEYPAFDTQIMSTPDVLLNCLVGKLTLNDELKSNRLRVWGNLHEGMIFHRIAQKILS